MTGADAFAIIFIIVLFIIVTGYVHAGIATGNTIKQTWKQSKPHASVPKRDDMTCNTEYGHAHDTSALEKEYGKRYIVHNEPETGYVILNGVKRKLKDCGKY